MLQKLRLFIIESLNPIDMLQERSEGMALEKICKIVGHDVALLQAHSKSDLNKYCDYISSIDIRGSRRAPLCIHIAAHGNRDGVQFGRDFLDWRSLFHSLEPLIKDMNSYESEIYISISACGAGFQQLANEIQSEVRSSQRFREDFCPPEYIFVTQGSGDRDETSWDDSAVSWTLLYHRLAKLRKTSEHEVRDILNNIEKSTETVLRSFRWNKQTRRYEKY